MVKEIAEYHAQPGMGPQLRAGLMQGLAIVRRAAGCRGVALRRGVEDEDLFVAEIEWETLEDHTERFRGGPLFAAYRSHINGLFVPPIVARHFNLLAEL